MSVVHTYYKEFSFCSINDNGFSIKDISYEIRSFELLIKIAIKMNLVCMLHTSGNYISLYPTTILTSSMTRSTIFYDKKQKKKGFFSHHHKTWVVNSKFLHVFAVSIVSAMLLITFRANKSLVFLRQQNNNEA